MQNALMQSFGVPTVREAFNGPSKFVVDGEVELDPPKPKQCVAGAFPASYGVTCLCAACVEDEDEDGFNFD